MKYLTEEAAYNIMSFNEGERFNKFKEIVGNILKLIGKKLGIIKKNTDELEKQIDAKIQELENGQTNNNDQTQATNNQQNNKQVEKDTSKVTLSIIKLNYNNFGSTMISEAEQCSNEFKSNIDKIYSLRTSNAAQNTDWDSYIKNLNLKQPTDMNTLFSKIGCTRNEDGTFVKNQMTFEGKQNTINLIKNIKNNSKLVKERLYNISNDLAKFQSKFNNDNPYSNTDESKWLNVINQIMQVYSKHFINIYDAYNILSTVIYNNCIEILNTLKNTLSFSNDVYVASESARYFPEINII